MILSLDAILNIATFLLVLLNPFLLAIYLLSLIRQLRMMEFLHVMVRGAMISGVVFFLFAWFGDLLFRDILQVRFAAFLVFGGIVFLVIGIRFVFQGPETIELLRGDPEQVATSVAMPFMIGPGTINASILAGSRLNLGEAALAILSALTITTIGVLLLKGIHDYVSQRNSQLVERYVDLCGRISALLVGTIAIEMIFRGLEQWWQSLNIAG